MNTAYLQHDKVKQEVTRIWTEDRSVQSTFFTRTRKFVRFYKQYYRNQAAVSRREEQVARDSFAAAQATLQVDPQNAAAQLTLAQRNAQLLSFEAKKAEGCRLRARLKWKAKGDTMSREFFQAVRGKSPKTPIAELMSPIGEPITQQKDIERACVTFYKELYKAPERGELHQQGERRILDAITVRISPLMASSLGQPLSVSELHQAAGALAKEKAPGPDGFSMNFFTLFWPLIGPDFHLMIQDSIITGRFPHGVTRGLITLIPKSGDLKFLNNWRPITLLNVGYKIYAKALQMRLQDPLSEIISSDQSAYLRNRFILDNILLTHETLS